MSVERSGPQGYRYQYLASLLIALQVISKDEVQIYIERENSEDAKIIFQEDDRGIVIDVQAKKRSSQIEIKEFAKWISHFQKRSFTHNLITSLNENSDRFVIFITNARCKDDVSLFVDSDKLYCPLNISLNDEYLNMIRQNILSSFIAEGQLSKQRKECYEAFFEQVNNNELRNILKRMIVWDRFNYEYIEDKIKSILKKEFYVPENNLNDIISELMKIVIEEGRDKSRNISKMIKDILSIYKGNRVFKYDEKYYIRQEVSKCIDKIKSNNILPLTGMSLCGKTYIAKNTAQVLQDEGYNIRETNELFGEMGAIHFLNHSSIEERVCILEDPFGHSEVKVNSIELLAGIENLARNLPLHRKLIITSRKDILLYVTDKDNINKCKINNIYWEDITLTDNQNAIEIWKKYFSDEEDSIKLFNRIRGWLSKNENCEFLQPGQIAQLYYSIEDLTELKTMKIDYILKIARRDSKELADRLLQRGYNCKKVIIALGLGANTVNSIHIDDLAYILSNADEIPSIFLDKKSWSGICYTSGKSIETPAFPQYNEFYKLCKEHKDELKYLLRHRYITTDNVNNSILFTHPIYHQASKIIFKSNIDCIFEKKETIQIANRGLGALCKETALNTLKMLESVFLEQKSVDIKELILKGLYSIFPSVKDRVISIFDRRINELSEEEQRDFVRTLMENEKVSNDGILWYRGEAWYNTSDTRKFSGRHLFKEATDKNSIHVIKETIAKGEKITAEQIWDIITSTYSEDILLKAMDFDESFIREEAIYKLFKLYAFKYDSIEMFLDKHEHPNVKFKLFKGALQSWNKYSCLKKFQIVGFIKDSFMRMSVAIRFKGFLENFQDEYYRDSIDWKEFSTQEKYQLWHVWYELVIELLEKFPSKYSEMRESHLNNAMNSALEFIKDQSKIINVANAWYNWLDNYSDYKRPDDYGMSIMDFVMKGTLNNGEIRKDLIQKMLRTENTSFMTSHMKYLADYWSYLSLVEKNMMLQIFKSNRKDVDWIKAVVLNRGIVPVEIQKALFNEILLENEPKEIIRKMDTRLLEYCLNIHCGYPQPLWWNGYHHCNYKIWDKVIIRVLKNKNYKDKSFDIALRELLDSLYNYEENRFENGYEIWKNLNIKSPKDMKDILFYRLLYMTVSQNQSNKTLWDIFIESCKEEELNIYLDQIVDNIEGIQNYHTTYDDLFELFDKNIIYKEIIPRLKGDNIIFNLCDLFHNLEEMPKDILNKNEKNLIDKKNHIFTSLIKATYSNNPPRLSLSNKITLHTMKKLNIHDNEIEILIEENRKRLNDIVSETEEKLYEHYEHYELDNWKF